jgi:hypothetical protein
MTARIPEVDGGQMLIGHLPAFLSDPLALLQRVHRELGDARFDFEAVWASRGGLMRRNSRWALATADNCARFARIATRGGTPLSVG